MKNRVLVPIIALSLLPGFSAFAHDGDHEHITGPNGGRMLHAVEPHLEFLVLEGGKVKISAIGDGDKAIPIADQSVKLTGGNRTNPTRMTFAKVGDALVSNETLPDLKSFPVVLQIKSGSGKSVLEKFQLNLADCPTCDFLEYACSCDHDHDHDHKDEKKKS